MSLRSWLRVFCLPLIILVFLSLGIGLWGVVWLFAALSTHGEGMLWIFAASLGLFFLIAGVFFSTIGGFLASHMWNPKSLTSVRTMLLYWLFFPACTFLLCLVLVAFSGAVTSYPLLGVVAAIFFALPSLPALIFWSQFNEA